MTDLRKAAEMALEALEAKDGWGSSVRESKEKAIEALRTALAQPEQEPVAWQVTYLNDEGIPQISWFPHPVHPESPLGKRPHTSTPLYTAPPKREWVGLTDEERWQCDTGDAWAMSVNTEAKLKEKNGG